MSNGPAQPHELTGSGGVCPVRSLFAAQGLTAAAQCTERPAILILGTYHMANPGRDVHNMQAHDVLSATRQQEIADLIDVLKRFRPTRIAVEAAVGSARSHSGMLITSRGRIHERGFDSRRCGRSLLRVRTVR
jgi:hypothetical protein